MVATFFSVDKATKKLEETTRRIPLKSIPMLARLGRVLFSFRKHATPFTRHSPPE